MTRKFTLRENIIMLVLVLVVLGGAYFLLVARPVALSIEKAENEAILLDDEIVLEQAKAEMLETMELALAERLQIGTFAQTPDYDNQANLLRELNTVLKTATDTNMSFKPPVFDGNIATRETQLTFVCAGGYRQAKAIIDDIYSGPYRCDIATIKVAPKNSGTENTIMDEEVSVSLKIYYYELLA